MGHDAVDAVGGAVEVDGAGGVDLAEGAGDVAVFAVDDGGLRLLGQQLLDLFRAPFGRRLPLRVSRTAAQGALRLGVALKELQGPVAGRKLAGQLVALLHEAGDDGQFGLDRGAVVDVHLTRHAVAALEEVDDRVEQRVDTIARAGHGGHHRYADHAAQLLVVERGAARFQLVVHVERDDGRLAEVDQFGGEVEVALEVGGHDDIQDHVRPAVEDMLTHVPLLGRIGREGVGAGQVGDVEAVAFVGDMPRFGGHGDAAIVAHVFASAGDDVEERRLAAVGVAHEGHVDFVLAWCGLCVGRRATVRRVVRVRCLLRAVRQGLVGFVFGQHFDHGCLAASEGDLIAHDAVFDGVVQRGIEHRRDLLSAYKAHLYNASAESSVSRHTHNDGRVAVL